MTQATANNREVRKRLAKLAEFAATVDLLLKRHIEDDGELLLVLYGKDREPLCREFDTSDMADSIGVYAGSHPAFEDARKEYELFASEVSK